MFQDEEILAMGPPSAFGVSDDDSSSLADYFPSHPPSPLCHSTPVEDSYSDSELMSTAPNINDFDTIRPFLQNILKADERQPGRELRNNLDSASVPISSILPSEIQTAETLQNLLGSSGTETSLETHIPPDLAPKYHYWLRERKPKKSNEFEDTEVQVTRVEKVMKNVVKMYENHQESKQEFEKPRSNGEKTTKCDDRYDMIMVR